MTARFIKYHILIKFVLIFVFILTWSDKLNAHCTAYHPHHCVDDIVKTGKRYDPTNPHSDTRSFLRWVDRNRIDAMHLGGQGCRAKANDVMSRFSTKRGLTSFEKKYLHPFFGDKINLDRVTVYWGANLNNEMKVGGKTIWVASAAQTFGYRLFFRERRNEGSSEQLIALAHELEHTVQHERAGGLKRFCQKYMSGYFDAGLNYSNNRMERDAFNRGFEFARYLSKQHSVDEVRIPITHGGTNSNRTVWVPEWLGDKSYYHFSIDNDMSNTINYRINNKKYETRPGYTRTHKFTKCYYLNNQARRCNNTPSIRFDGSFSEGYQGKSYAVGVHSKYHFKSANGNSIDFYRFY